MRARPQSLVMADMPFMSYTTPEDTMQNATALMQAGAQMVKMEGCLLYTSDAADDRRGG